jgi:steroid delta-isomerase-like uncharacterized protein
MAESNRHIMERTRGGSFPLGMLRWRRSSSVPTSSCTTPDSPNSGAGTLLALFAANREAFPDLVWTPEQMAADGDTVAVRYSMTGTQRGSFAGVASTGKPVVSQSMAFYSLADGEIIEERAQLDMLGFLQQIGAAEVATEKGSEKS